MQLGPLHQLQMLLMRQHIIYRWLFRAKQASRTEKKNEVKTKRQFRLIITYTCLIREKSCRGTVFWFCQAVWKSQFVTWTHRDHNICPDWTLVWLSEYYYIIGKQPCHRGWSVKDSGTQSRNELILNLAARWRIEAALWFETWLQAVSVWCRRRRPGRVQAVQTQSMYVSERKEVDIVL